MLTEPNGMPRGPQTPPFDGYISPWKSKRRHVARALYPSPPPHSLSARHRHARHAAPQVNTHAHHTHALPEARSSCAEKTSQGALAHTRHRVTPHTKV